MRRRYVVGTWNQDYTSWVDLGKCHWGNSNCKENIKYFHSNLHSIETKYKLIIANFVTFYNRYPWILKPIRQPTKYWYWLTEFQKKNALYLKYKTGVLLPDQHQYTFGHTWKSFMVASQAQEPLSRVSSNRYSDQSAHFKTIFIESKNNRGNARELRIHWYEVLGFIIIST